MFNDVIISGIVRLMLYSAFDEPLPIIPFHVTVRIPHAASSTYSQTTKSIFWDARNDIQKKQTRAQRRFISKNLKIFIPNIQIRFPFFWDKIINSTFCVSSYFRVPYGTRNSILQLRMWNSSFDIREFQIPSSICSFKEEKLRSFSMRHHLA